MRPPCAAEAAGTWLAAASRRLGRVLPAAGSEQRQLLSQPFGPALWARSTCLATGAHKEFGVFPAFPAMKLINRHGRMIADYVPVVKVNADPFGRLSSQLCIWPQLRLWLVFSVRWPNYVLILAQNDYERLTSELDMPRQEPSNSIPIGFGVLRRGRGQEIDCRVCRLSWSSVQSQVEAPLLHQWNRRISMERVFAA